ncbi:MAG: transketolase [Burkholderiales bacterium PBB4]|nr:MAG: transketolase [Burkholderiales bacterium PBB4]
MEFDINPRNARNWSRIGSRGVYGLAMYEAAKSDPSVLAVSADLGKSSGLDRLAADFSGQFVNCGIAEQNMVSFSAGLSRAGFKVFASSFAPFIAMRASEQVRMNLGYMEEPVKLVAIGSGLAMGFLGNSHYGIEDLAVMRSIPNMTVVSPADCAEIFKGVEAAKSYSFPLYIRLTGAVNNPVVYQEDYDFRIGRIIQLSKGADVTILASGTMVAAALQAAEKLREAGADVGVVNVHTVTPLDQEGIRQLFSETRRIVTVEEHTLVGGLGSAIAEFKADENLSAPMLRLGIRDKFVKTGDYAYLLVDNGLDADAIARSIANWMEI